MVIRANHRSTRPLRHRLAPAPLRWPPILGALVVLPAAAAAQQVDSSVSIGGVLFANYQYTLRPAGGANRFDLERAYLTVSGPLADRVSFRITTDVYQQQRDTVDRSWQVRAKYAYAQYDYSRNPTFPAWVRLGMLQTVFIDHDETFWPRWISSVPTDRHGYFSSADVGLSTRVGLPARSGEMYATVTNGTGFASREADRFKDYAARLTLNPLAHDLRNPLRSLAITGWIYKGAIAGRFAEGGTGQESAVGEALRRDRWGVFTAIAHARFTGALQYARRIDEGESGSNTTADPRVLVDSAGSLLAGYVIVRPFSGRGERLSLIGRWDRVNVNVATPDHHDLLITALAWAVSPRFSVAVDLQSTLPRAGSGATATRILFLHTQTRF